MFHRKRFLSSGVSVATGIAALALMTLPASAGPWSGPYVGVQAGYQWDETSDVPWGAVAPTPNNDGPLIYDSFIGGGHAGFNWQSTWLVLGAEADIEAAPGEGDDEDRGGHINGIDTNFQFSVRGRVGAAWPSWLLYVTGGYAYLDADAVVRDVPAQPTISTSFDGWALGAGIEHLMGPLSLRVEYRYTDYAETAETYNVAGYVLAFEPDIHSVRAGLSWHF